MHWPPPHTQRCTCLRVHDREGGEGRGGDGRGGDKRKGEGKEGRKKGMGKEVR